MDDDLNTAEALAAIFEYVRATNTAIDDGQFREENRWDAARVLEIFDSIFDILKPSDKRGQQAASDLKDGTLSDAEVEAYIAERAQAKKARNFARSDEIRASLLEKSVILEDTKDGVRWKRK